MTESQPFSRTTLALFAGFLNQATLSAQHPNLVEAAKELEIARAELSEAIKALPIVLPIADDPA